MALAFLARDAGCVTVETAGEEPVSPDLTTHIRGGMALALFALGLLSCSAGLWTILSREYQRSLKGIAAQSNRLHARSLTEVGLVPILDASARLVEATTQMIRTAMGIGAFLCLIGLAMTSIALWVLLV